MKELILAVALFFAGIGVGWVWKGGSEKNAVIHQQQKDAQEVQKHEEKQKVVTKEVIKYKTVLQKVPDPTGCLDQPVPDDFVDGMRGAYRATRP